MMTRSFRFAVAIALLLAILILGGVTLAQTGGGYDLSWWTVDGGSGAVSGGGYLLQGVAGQPDVGDAQTGGGYTLTSGFWSGGGASTCPDVYEPNESFGAAITIPTGSPVQSYICNVTDLDWFRFGVIAGQTITVDLTNLPADYDLELFDPGQGSVGNSAGGGTADEHITHMAAASGAYRVEVVGYNGAFDAAHPYILRVQISGGPAQKKLYNPMMLK